MTHWHFCKVTDFVCPLKWFRTPLHPDIGVPSTSLKGHEHRVLEFYQKLVIDKSFPAPHFGGKLKCEETIFLPEPWTVPKWQRKIHWKQVTKSPVRFQYPTCFCHLLTHVAHLSISLSPLLRAEKKRGCSWAPKCAPTSFKGIKKKAESWLTTRILVIPVMWIQWREQCFRAGRICFKVLTPYTPTYISWRKRWPSLYQNLAEPKLSLLGPMGKGKWQLCLRKILPGPAAMSIQSAMSLVIGCFSPKDITLVQSIFSMCRTFNWVNVQGHER